MLYFSIILLSLENMLGCFRQGAAVELSVNATFTHQLALLPAAE